MKVKIFTDYDEDKLCEKINEFLENVNVLDMKYQNISDERGQCFYTVLIMFEV